MLLIIRKHTQMKVGNAPDFTTPFRAAPYATLTVFQLTGQP